MLRVTTNTFYRQATLDILRLQREQYGLNQQVSSGRRINQPSDDSLRSVLTQYTHRQLEQVTQYDQTVNHARSWLNQASSCMSSMTELLTRAKELSEQMATGTYSADEREMIATEANHIVEQLITLANTQVNGAYIFSGTRTDQAAATANILADNPSVAGAANAGDGLLYGQGGYTGRLSRNISLTVDGAYAGGVPAAANTMDVDLSYVDDYGRTITRTVTLSGTGTANAVDIGDGVEVYAENLSYTAGDTFTLALGRNQGNGDSISANMSWDTRMSYNYTLDDLFGVEGYTSGKFQNILDQLTDWADYLGWDNTDRSSFEGIGATYNNPASTGNVQVTGDFTDLDRAQMEFFVGQPVQSLSDDADLSNYRNFQVDAGYAGGAPTAANTMDVNYEYWNGAAWTPQTATVTGTGSGSTVTLVGGVEIFMVNASYSASDGPWQLTPVYPEDTEPSGAQPLTMTYTYQDGGGSRVYDTVTFTGTGSANAQALSTPFTASLELSSGGTFDDDDAFALSLAQYDQGQQKSSELLPTLEAATSKLLNYIADSGAKLNRLEVRERILGDDSLRLFERLEQDEDADVTTLVTDLQILQTMYQAALQSTATVTSISLADYI